MTIQLKQFKPGNGAIYYFSGTGNTAFVAGEFQENYKKANVSVDLFKIEDIDVVSSQSKYDFLMIGFPVYASYPPDLVVDFVKKLPEVKDKPVILFATAGLTTGISFNVLEKILKKKKYNVISNFAYIMPDNVYFVFRKDTDKDEQIELSISNTIEKIKQDFKVLISGKSKFKKANFFWSLFAPISKFFFFKIMQPQKNRFVWNRDACNYCGLCQKICPTKNITIKKEKSKLTFKNNCVFCTRCYNFCPQKAIHNKSINRTEKYRRYTRLKKEII
ncbi:MAG TPA: EFR1 family ferrodoxin [Candidatus Diapherotrites archaeon]|jgi:flavodoxin/ferredoxin|nr:EFR1 family ferrodoxin [Candidatus Diapherotrites archaeon]